MVFVFPRTVEKRSRRFLASLDRTSLGRFAADDDALFLTDFVYRAGMTHGGIPKIPINSSYFERHDEWIGVLGRGDGDLMWRLDSEAMFWWMRTGDKKMVEHYREHYKSDIADEAVRGTARLALIHDNPAMHDYFEVGIWDMDFIGQCIADGIDPDLALSVSRNHV